MRKKAGFSLAEVVIGLTILGFTMTATMGMMMYVIKSTENTTRDAELGDPTAMALRQISDTLRRSISTTISTDGKTIQYTLPAKNASADPVTGEKELFYPLKSDNVLRSYTVVNNTLVDNSTGKVILRDILSTDPDPASSQYNLAYKPFQLTTVGTRRAITITLITGNYKKGGIKTSHMRSARMKTTVVVQNIR